ASPTLRSSLEIGVDFWDAQLFMHEDRALLLVRTYPRYDYWYGDGDPEGGGGQQEQQGLDLQQYFGSDYWGSVTRLVEVDISDPDAMKIVSNLYITGDLVSARMVEGVARVVVRSGPTGLEMKDPYEFFDYEAHEASDYDAEHYDHRW